MADETINIKITRTGDKEAAQGIQDIGTAAETTGKKVEQANQFLDALKRTLAALGIVASVEAAKELSDTYSGMISRLKLVSQNQAELVKTEQQLFDISQRTRGSFAETVDLYNKLALQAGNLGLDAKELGSTLETVNQAIAISGTGAQQAKQGLLQFSQGLASNRFQGQDLKAVLEDIPFLGQQIAQGMGVTTAGLRALGEEGKLSAKAVLDALAKQAPEIAKQFQAITPTISQAFQVLSNQVLRFVGQEGQVSGASAAIARAILVLADNFKLLVASIETAITAWLAFRAALFIQPYLVALSAGLASVQTALNTYILAAEIAGTRTTIFGRAAVAASVPVAGLRAAVVSLWAVIAANPFTIIITAIAAAAAAVYFFGNQIKLTSDGSITLLGAIVGAWNLLGDAINYVKNLLAPFVGPIWQAIKSAASAALNFLVTGFNMIVDVVSRIGGIFSGLPGTLGSLGNTIVDAMKKATAAMQDTGLAAANLGQGFGGATNSVAAGADTATKSLSKLEQEMGVQVGRVNADLIPAFTGAAKMTEELSSRMAASLAHVREQVKAYNDEVLRMALYTRNAMGDMVKATDEWSLRSGAAFNAVKDGASAMAQEVVASNDNVIASYNAVSAAAEKAASFSSQSTYLPDIQSVLKSAGAQGNFDAGQFQNLLRQSDLSYGQPRGNDTLIALNNFLKGVPPAVAHSIVQSLGYLNSRFQSAGLPTFANGGEFQVGGSGGTDSQLVQFMASPNEKVIVQTPSQQRNSGGRNITVNFQVNANDANSFRRSQSQMLLSLYSKLASVG